MNNHLLTDLIVAILLAIGGFVTTIVFMVNKGWLPRPIIRTQFIDEHVVKLHHEEDLLQRMMEIAFPESANATFERDLSTWVRSPISYKASLVDRVSSLSSPN